MRWSNADADLIPMRITRELRINAFPPKTPTIFIISMPATAIGSESLQLPTSIAN